MVGGVWTKVILLFNSAKEYILRLGTRTVFSQDDKRLNFESRQKLQKLLSSFVSAILFLPRVKC